jgi:hypothetical protein
MPLDRHADRYKCYLEWVSSFHNATLLTHNVEPVNSAVQKCLQGFTIGETSCLSRARRIEGLQLELEGLELLLTALDIERAAQPHLTFPTTSAVVCSVQRMLEAKITQLRKVSHD